MRIVLVAFFVLAVAPIASAQIQIPRIPGLTDGEPSSPSGVWVPAVEIQRCFPMLPLFSVHVVDFKHTAPVMGKEQPSTIVKSRVELPVAAQLGCYTLEQIRTVFRVAPSRSELSQDLDELSGSVERARNDVDAKTKAITKILDDIPQSVLSDDVRALLVAKVLESFEVVELRRDVDTLKKQVETLMKEKKKQ